MSKVFCVGLTTCDLLFAQLDTFPQLGKESVCKDFMIKPGGAANTPIALSKLGIETIYATTIGDDVLGKVIYEGMKKDGLDMSAVLVNEKARTSVSAVLAQGKDRAFASYFGEIDIKALTEQMERYIPQCTHVHTYIYDCLNTPVIEIAKKYGKTISVDTAWDENLRLKDIKHIMQASEIIFLNEVEACNITQTKTAEEALNILGQYAKTLVIKMGEKGSLIKKGDRCFEMPVIKGVSVVDTTGAGDLYCVGFLYGHLNGWDLKNSARLATASGNLAVTFYGGTDEKYSMENVMELYDKL